MAVTWDVDKSRMERGSTYLFDPSDIVIKKDLNGRKDLPDITELIASIEEHGQLEPVVVRKEQEKPVLSMGFSRWRAIVAINKKRSPENKMRIIAIYSQCSEEDGFIMNWEENRRRNATTPMDDARHFAQLKKWGNTVAQIAERLKVSKALVSKRLKLMELEPSVQKAVDDKRLTADAAEHIGKLAAEQQREAVKGGGKIKSQHVNAKPSVRAIVDFCKRASEETNIGGVKLFIAELLEFIEGK